jgi:hypothetical protein
MNRYPCEACEGEGGACCDGRGWIERGLPLVSRSVSGVAIASMIRLFGYQEVYGFWASKYREGRRFTFRYF